MSGLRAGLSFTLVLLALCVSGSVFAQDTLPLAQELITVKGGYADKKKDLEELRVRAYIPILLKAVGKGAAWKPGHPNWEATEKRINVEWRKLYADYMAGMGRDAGFAWMDEALAREYVRLFSDEELNTLLNFYKSPPGTALIALEKRFLVFYPAELVQSLSRVMIGYDALSAREQAAFRSPQNRERREFVVMFESEMLLSEESLRIGGTFIAENSNAVQQGALATAADEVDALRGKVDAATLTAMQTFLKTETARKERDFLLVAVPTATPAQEDPAQAKQEETAFYKALAALSAQWRAVAANASASANE